MGKADRKTIRLLLVDDHALFRESVARLLQSEPGFEVVAHCASGTEALRIVTTLGEIDVVLLDLDLGQEHGTKVLDSLRRAGFEGKVLLVTAGVNDSELPRLIQKGISGVFLKNGSPGSLIQGIRDAMDGKVLFGLDLLQRALKSPTIGTDVSCGSLTERERLVLSFVFEGLSNKQIANRLQISESAVKASLQQLFAKTGVRTRGQLVRVALEQYQDQL
jgi:two-component system, NarL family, nitrate/nitrite response regulator NarL